jgi:hypothetical protein
MPGVQAKKDRRPPYKFKARDETYVGVPKNGAWFSTLLLMLSQAPPDAFLVAWDTPTGGKCFGYYKSPKECYDNLSENELRCCYEIFVHGDTYREYPARSPTLVYGDLEWVGVEDTHHVHAREILRRLHTVCEKKLGFTPEIVVSCSTRMTAKGLKNSYHYVFKNLYTDKCDDIKQLFLPETLRTGVDDDLKEFDFSVYSVAQQLRMGLCSKRGSDVLFRRINKNLEDPEDDFTAHFEDDDLDAILGSLVTVFDKDDPTIHLLKPWTLVPKPEPESPPSAGAKRPAAQASLDTPGRDVRPRTGNPTESAEAVADLLVAMHPDQIGHGYDSFRDVVFGVTNAAGNSPEVVKILKEWIRIREKADHRDQEWPRIEAGSFASAGGGGSATIGMGGLVYRQKQYAAAHYYLRASNGEPFPNCRTLIDPKDVWMFDLFTKFMHHVHHKTTSWKWLVQFAYYVVPKLKDQMYAIIQGEYAGVTKADFDVVWNVEQPSEIYEFSFKSYLQSIVKDINSHIAPLVTTAVGEPDGEATASPTETVRASQSKDLEDIHTLLEIIKTTASHSSKSTRIAELIRTAVLHTPTLKCFPEWDHVTGQADGDPDWDDIQQSLETLQTQLNKASTSQETAAGKTQEAYTTVSHVRTTSKAKARGQWSKRFTKEEVAAMIVKISPHVYSLQPEGVMAKAIRGVLQVHKDVEEEVKRLVEQWKSMQGKEPDTVTQLGDVARYQNSVGDVSEEHTNGESMEVTSEELSDGDESMEDASEELCDGDESMGGGVVEHCDDDESVGDTSVECGNAVVMTDMQAHSDGGDNADFKSLKELASSHPNLVWNHDITTASRSDSPATKMIKVFLENLDRRQVTDDLSLIRTCCLLQMARANNSQIQDTAVPEELFKFLISWSETQGRRFDDRAAKRVKAAWECARVDIEKGSDWQLFADSLWLEIFNNLFSYKAVKKKFELRNFKVMDMSCYAFITSDGKPTPRKQAELSTNYGNLWCWSRVVTPVSDDNEEEIVEFKCTKFLPSWFNDESMRTYAKFDCIAPSKSGHVVPPDVFNTWTGFLAAKLPAVPDDEVAELIEPFIQHYRLVICSTEEQVQFQLAWFARQVQDPANKTGVGIIYMGDQGVGKDIVTEFIVEKVFGTDVATQSGEVTHLFEKHSLERENKVLCVLDEASGAKVKEYIPNIKATMVAPRISFNAKFGAIYKLLCIINYMFTSNDTLPMPIEASDRRMVVFQCNNSKKGDTGYFNKILRSAANPRAARAFFQFLQKFDLSGYENFQACRPETAMYRRLKEMSLSLFYQFMSFKCVQQADFEYDVQGATYIFDSLKEWADGANIKRSDYTKTQLGLDFAHLMENYADHGVTKNRRSSGMQYRIEWAKLEACLKRYSLFDSNAM